MAISSLSELRERVSALLADLPDAVRLLDSGGRELWCNEASALLAPGGLGHLCGDGTTGRDPSCPACQVEEVLERGTFLRWHVSISRDETTADYYEVTLNPVRDSSERICGVLEIVRDATASLGLEQYLISRVETRDDEVLKRSEEAIRTAISRELQPALDATLAGAERLGGLARGIRSALSALDRAASDPGLVERIATLEREVEAIEHAARRIAAAVRVR